MLRHLPAVALCRYTSGSNSCCKLLPGQIDCLAGGHAAVPRRPFPTTAKSCRSKQARGSSARVWSIVAACYDKGHYRI